MFMNGSKSFSKILIKGERSEMGLKDIPSPSDFPGLGRGIGAKFQNAVRRKNVRIL